MTPRSGLTPLRPLGAEEGPGEGTFGFNGRLMIWVTWRVRDFLARRLSELARWINPLTECELVAVMYGSTQGQAAA